MLSPSCNFPDESKLRDTCRFTVSGAHVWDTLGKLEDYISVSEDHLPVYCILISLKLWVLRRIDGGHRAVCGVGRVVVHRRLLMKRVIGEGPVVHTVRHPSQTPTPGVVCREVIFELQGSKQKIKWTTVSSPKNK